MLLPLIAAGAGPAGRQDLSERVGGRQPAARAQGQPLGQDERAVAECGRALPGGRQQQGNYILVGDAGWTAAGQEEYQRAGDNCDRVVRAEPPHHSVKVRSAPLATVCTANHVVGQLHQKVPLHLAHPQGHPHSQHTRSAYCQVRPPSAVFPPRRQIVLAHTQDIV